MALFDEAKMAAYLAEKLNAEDLTITSVWKNLEGWSMETFSLGLAYTKNGEQVNKDIIIRREPVSGLLEPYDASIEYRVLSALSDTDIAVPETYWYEPDGDVFERPFYVMEKVEGVVHMWSMTRASMDPNFRLIPDDEERLSIAADFVTNIARIHTVDWRSRGLDFLSDPGPGTGSALAQVEYWEEVIARAGFRNKPSVAYATNWLKDNLVENDTVRLIHGDYRTGNYIAKDNHIQAILDWEMVHLGDPHDDLSYIISSTWRSARPQHWVSHLLPLDAFYARYEDASGIRVEKDKIKFYHVLNDYKAIGIGVTAANAFGSTNNPDLRVGVFGMTRYLTIYNAIKTLNKYIAKEGR